MAMKNYVKFGTNVFAFFWFCELNQVIMGQMKARSGMRQKIEISVKPGMSRTEKMRQRMEHRLPALLSTSEPLDHLH